MNKNHPHTNFLSKFDFGNEAGDDVSAEDLRKYFFKQDAFESFCDINNRIAVATAKKGVGKSALLTWTSGEFSKRPEQLVIQCRGADLSKGRYPSVDHGSSPNDRIRSWMVRICSLINRNLALQVGFAASDDKISLVESAELEGFKQRNLVGSLLDRFKKMLPGGGPDTTESINEIEVLKRQKSNVWIMIDDLDATFQNTSDEILELSTFFTAARYPTRDIKGLGFRITMRSDVWPIIRRSDEALDKVEQYVNEIRWSREDFRNVLCCRVRHQLDRLGSDFEPSASIASDDGRQRQLLSLVLADTMEWSQHTVPSYHVLYTVSYQRPRWGIQLCKLAQAEAVKENSQIIHKYHIDQVWGEYGTKRVADLVAEHKHQCSQIEDLVTSFRSAPRLFSREELFDWINRRVANHVRPVIEGVHTRNSKDIARFLYRIGFILARSDSSEGYEHYTFDQMPDFLSSKTNEDFGVSWEIHPCYREALDIRKVDRSHKARFGRDRSRQ